MSDTTQPSYYWISHQNNDLQQFSISVTLRRIHTDSSPHTLTHYSMDRQGVDVNVNKTFHAAVSNDEENNIAHQEASSSFAQTTHENIFWQEKLLGPKEMIEHEQFFQRPKKLYDGTHTNDNGIEKLNPEGAGTSGTFRQSKIGTSPFSSWNSPRVQHLVWFGLVCVDLDLYYSYITWSGIIQLPLTYCVK